MSMKSQSMPLTAASIAISVERARRVPNPISTFTRRHPLAHLPATRHATLSPVASVDDLQERASTLRQALHESRTASAFHGTAGNGGNLAAMNADVAQVVIAQRGQLASGRGDQRASGAAATHGSGRGTTHRRNG
ncbi:MAG: hypothetical protein R3D03_14255 [Geminicoccaceae bacterium]